MNVPVRIIGAGAAGSGTLQDLSVSGAYVATSLPLESLQRVRLQVARGGRTPLDLWGLVVRNDGRGIGVEWQDPVPLDLLLTADPLAQPRQDAAPLPRLAQA